MFLTGRTSYLSSDASVLVQQELRRAFDNVVRELREACGGADPDGAGPLLPPACSANTTMLGNGSVQLNFQIARDYNVAVECPGTICWGSEVATGEWVHYSIVNNVADNVVQLIRCRNGDKVGAITAFDGASCRVLANNIKHPNTATPPSAAFVVDVPNKLVTVNLQIEYRNRALPTGAQSTSVLTSRVKLRN